jgi:hypothetical protein
MLEPPQLSYVAVNQLAAWEKLAEDLPVSHDAQYDRARASSERDRSYRCGDCGKGIALAIDEQGAHYRYTHEQWLALVVLHLRNFHEDLDPDKH